MIYVLATPFDFVLKRGLSFLVSILEMDMIIGKNIFKGVSKRELRERHLDLAVDIFRVLRGIDAKSYKELHRAAIEYFDYWISVANAVEVSSGIEGIMVKTFCYNRLLMSSQLIPSSAGVEERLSLESKSF